MEENKRLGFTNKEDLIRDVIQFMLNMLKSDYHHVEVSKEECEQLEDAFRKASMSYACGEDFIVAQMNESIERGTRTYKENDVYKILMIQTHDC